jgi:hypothetical protein
VVVLEKLGRELEFFSKFLYFRSMKFIRIEDAKAGDILAKDLSDSRGVLLFKAGTVLTQEMLSRLRLRMVRHLFVEDSVASGLSEEEIKKMEGEIEIRLENIFSDVKENPVMRSLCESAKKVLKSRLK